MEWTEPARLELERYLEQLRLNLSRDGGDEGGDPDEVAEDMRRHVHEELTSKGVQVVTRESLEPILGALGALHGPADTGSETFDRMEPESFQPRAKRGFLGVLCLLSILLSVITLTTEAVTHMCADSFFDPIPSAWHVMLVLFVPVAQAIVALMDDASTLRKRRWLGVISGLGIGVSAYYSLLFLPILPLAVIGLVFGVGLLAMSPFFALITSLYLHSKLRTANATGTRMSIPTVWAGIALGAFLLPALELPEMVTNYGMRTAASEDPVESARGVEFLRSFGNEDRMLSSCYAVAGGVTDPITSFLNAADPVFPDNARVIYYRVTGHAFNSVEPPAEWRSNWLRSPRFSWTERAAQGGSEVAGRNSGLVLSGSRIDSKVNAVEATAYTEWTLRFRNDSRIVREARAQVLLPPGSVVSRLTLWVDGEEREAAFAGVGQTRAAYQSIVRRRQDPVLVTSSGPDRVLVQCFPVPANGGEMKVRLGITTPLGLDDEAEGILGFSSFAERNFGIGRDVEHSIWIESTHTLSAGTSSLTYEKPEGDFYTARGELSERELTEPGTVVLVERPSESRLAWAEQSFGEGDSVVLQEIESTPVEAPSRLVIVVDGSVTMGEYSEAVARALEALRPLEESLEVGVIFAGDVPKEAVEPQLAGHQLLIHAAQFIYEYDYVGGRDVVPALVEAWDRCAERDSSIILLVHGAQPVELSSLDPLKQRMERRSGGPLLLTVRATGGSNVWLRELETKADLAILAREGDLESDLRGLFGHWSAGEELRIVRREVPATDVIDSTDAIEATRHVARLWARGTILGARRAHLEGWRKPAVNLASHYQLVTPVSGAVVLETAAQFEAAGLEPGDPNSVPSVPEPEMVLLILITLCVLAASWRRQRAFA